MALLKQNPAPPLPTLGDLSEKDSGALQSLKEMIRLDMQHAFRGECAKPDAAEKSAITAMARSVNNALNLRTRAEILDSVGRLGHKEKTYILALVNAADPLQSIVVGSAEGKGAFMKDPNFHTNPLIQGIVEQCRERTK